jgi:3-phenylpropionate/trans-cinnamate dioxygenase ferredoxin reductase component
MSTERHRTAVILGAGPAGIFAAYGARKAGFAGRIIVIGAESCPPYERPSLSKAYLAGRVEPPLLLEADVLGALELDLRLGSRGARVRPDLEAVELLDGTVVQADAGVIVATGAEPVELPMLPRHLDNVHYLRERVDADRLATALQPGPTGQMLVVGAGFVGLEVAATARVLGWDVVIVEAAPTPLATAAGPSVGRWYTQLHQAYGVEIVCGDAITEVTLCAGAQAVARVHLASGRTVEPTLIVVGVGVMPRSHVMSGSGINVSGGIPVDAFGATELPHVYAAGDVALHREHPLFARPGRVEHWNAAIEQGLAVGSTMAGTPKRYEATPSFWSDQYDTTLQLLGRPDGDCQVIEALDNDESGGCWYWLRDAQVVAVAAVGRLKALRAARRLVGTRWTGTAEELAAS